MQSDSNEIGIHRNDKHFDKIDAAAAAAASAAAATAATISCTKGVVI